MSKRDERLQRAVEREEQKTREEQRQTREFIQAEEVGLAGKTVDELVAIWTKGVEKWANLKTAKRANQSYYVALAAIRVLRKRNQVIALLPVLDHPDPSVRSLAAAYLLPVATEAAERVLEEVASLRHIAGLGARMTLERWRTTGVGIHLDD